MKRSRELTATAPSFSFRLQLSSQGCGQTRPITAGNGLYSTIVRHAFSNACSSESPVFSRWAIVVIQPRMSVPLGQLPMHGASFSTTCGRSDDTCVAPLPPRRSGGFLVTGFRSPIVCLSSSVRATPSRVRVKLAS